METLKIKPSHPSQGDHVLINACDFCPAIHELWDAVESDQPETMRLSDIKAALIELCIPIPRNASKATCQALLDCSKK